MLVSIHLDILNERQRAHSSLEPYYLGYIASGTVGSTSTSVHYSSLLLKTCVIALKLTRQQTEPGCRFSNS